MIYATFFGEVLCVVSGAFWKPRLWSVEYNCIGKGSGSWRIVLRHVFEISLVPR